MVRPMEDDMAYQSKARQELAWEGLKSDDTNLPDELLTAIVMLAEAKESVEDLVRKHLPPARGKKWVFAYKHGVAIALADAGPSGNRTSYFAKS